MTYKFRYKQALEEAGFKENNFPPELQRLMQKADQAKAALEKVSGQSKAGLSAILAQVDAVICVAIQTEASRLASARIDQSKLDAMRRLALQRKKELNKDN